MFKRLGGAFLLAVLAACTQPPRAPHPPPASPPAPAQPPLASPPAAAPTPAPAPSSAPTSTAALLLLPPAGTYRIDPARSELRVLVYRAGALARLGHNHVILNRSLTGTVRVGSDLSESSVSIDVPALQFIVDDSEARQQEGADFSADVPEDAKSGTLHNLLSAAVLDAAAFPEITVSSTALSGTQDTLTATLTIRAAGHESVIDAPFTLQPGPAAALTATGSFDLRQTAVGLTPYSLMLGALQVQDVLHIKFTITATIS